MLIKQPANKDTKTKNEFCVSSIFRLYLNEKSLALSLHLWYNTYMCYISHRTEEAYFLYVSFNTYNTLTANTHVYLIMRTKNTYFKKHTFYKSECYEIYIYIALIYIIYILYILL